jgi:bifunctional non-homologous end joining protein LigD
VACDSVTPDGKDSPDWSLFPYARLKSLIVEQRPFTNLPESKIGRWGQGLTVAKMKECIWVKPKLVANFEFLEWTDTNHVRHIKFVGLRTDQ